MTHSTASGTARGIVWKKCDLKRSNAGLSVRYIWFDCSASLNNRAECLHLPSVSAACLGLGMVAGITSEEADEEAISYDMLYDMQVQRPTTTGTSFGLQAFPAHRPRNIFNW